MQALLKLPNPVNTLASLPAFYDSIESHICALISLGKSPESYGAPLIPIIFGKLPSDINCTVPYMYFIPYAYGMSHTHMWPNLRKPDIMAHTKIFSIKHYKNLVQETHLIKKLKVNLQRPKLGHTNSNWQNLGTIILRINEEYRNLWVVLVF